MQGSEPFELLTPRYRHYDYEFECYWHYYQVWGRVSYNPDVAHEIWEQAFAQRFGPHAGTRIMRALHAVSNILPRIGAARYHYRYFSTTRGWAGIMRLGNLPDYAKGTGTDVQQFQGYEDAAQQLLTKQFTVKRTSAQTSIWFNHLADRMLADVEAATASVQELDEPAAREFRATTTDLRILAHLARYHASRMRAAVWYNIDLQTKDLCARDRCIADESQAIEHWKKIVESASDVYPETLQFGAHRVGFSRHWQEELAKLEAGLDQLRKLPGEASLSVEQRQRLVQQQADPPSGTLSIDVARAAMARPGPSPPPLKRIPSFRQFGFVIAI